MKKIILLAVPFLAAVFPGFAKAEKIPTSGLDNAHSQRKQFQTEEEIFKNMKAGINPDFFNENSAYKAMRFVS